MFQKRGWKDVLGHMSTRSAVRRCTSYQLDIYADIMIHRAVHVILHEIDRAIDAGVEADDD